MSAPPDDDASRQAECVVQAIDAYLATFPWPAPTISSAYTTADNPMTKARAFLVATLAGTIRMSALDDAYNVSAAREREACAKIADGERWEREAMFSDIHIGQDMAARDIAAKIRARSTQQG